MGAEGCSGETGLEGCSGLLGELTGADGCSGEMGLEGCCGWAGLEGCIGTTGTAGLEGSSPGRVAVTVTGEEYIDLVPTRVVAVESETTGTPGEEPGTDG
jgi:hypothetical protein